MERRSTKRFPLNLPITVRWMTRSGIAEAQAESQDVSSGGIYFCLSQQIEQGSPVEIVMTLPDEITLVGRLLVCCKGRVQRTKAKALNRFGVAVQTKRYEFLHRAEGLEKIPVLRNGDARSARTHC